MARYTEEQKKELIKIMLGMHGAGNSTREIGEETGVPVRTVRRWLTEYGIKLKHCCTGRRKRIEYDRKELEALAEKGLILKEIGEKMGVSASTARVRLEECGIKINMKARKEQEKEKESINRGKQEKPAEPVKKCKTCTYRSASPNYGCNYSGITGHCRLPICTVIGCTVYQKGKRIRSRKETS